MSGTSDTSPAGSRDPDLGGAAPPSWPPAAGSDAEHRERLELVLEGTRLGMWDWNPQTNDVVFDERWAEMLGHTLAEIPFTLESWSSRVHPDDIEGCFADIQAHMNGEREFYENVHRMRHKDGSWVHILDRGRVAARDDEGRPIRFTGTHTDITAQRAAEMRARALAQGRTRFLATMSHEIRTPMHGMLGLMDLLSKTSLTPDQRRLLDLLRHSGKSLTHLIDDILDFSKAAEGQLSLDQRPVDTHALLHGVVELYGPRAQGKGIALNLEKDETLPPWIRADGHRLRQILANLINNAVKFTSEGTVTVQAGTGPLGLRFSVVDTGPGIVDTKAIFEPYNQASAAVAARHGGTGLGLAIVHELSRAMEGQVSVESVVDEGAAFHVDLPLTRCKKPALATEGGISAAGLEDLRVLVAEDNPINQLVLQAMLQPLVQSLHIVHTGKQAVRAARKQSPDIILMDLNMPELDGDDAARQIRALGLEMPLVAATADVLPETRERCEQAGFTAFLSKPFSQQQLLRMLHRVRPAAPAPASLS